MEKKKRNDILFFIVLYIVLFSVFFFTPYSADDYAEKLDAFNCTWSECILKAIRFGNGRFFGNLGMYSSLHSNLFRITVKPLLMDVIVCGVINLFDIKTVWKRILAAVLIIVPAQGFFSYCFIETPCFFNYVAPIAFFIVAAVIIKRLKEKNSSVLMLLLMLSSVFMQLFSENSTIIFLLSALFLLVFDIIERKTVFIEDVVAVIGALVGAAIMFFGPGIIKSKYELKYEMALYRGIFFKIPSIIGVVSKFAEMFTSAFAVILLLSIAEIIIVKKLSPEDRYKEWHIIIPVFYSGVSFMYSIVQSSELKVISSVKLLLLAGLSLFVINTVVIIIRFVQSKDYKIITISMISLSIIAVGMFTIVNQHGYRTFYLPVFLIILLTFMLYKYIGTECKIELLKNNKKILNTSFVLIAIASSLILSLQMIQNYDVYLMRDTYVEQKLQEGEKTIFVPKIPNKKVFREQYITYCEDYMLGENNSADIVFVDIEEWELFEQYQSLQDNPLKSITYVLSNYKGL